MGKGRVLYGDSDLMRRFLCFDAKVVIQIEN